MKIGPIDVVQFAVGAVGVLLLLAAWAAVLVCFARSFTSDRETWLDRLLTGERSDRRPR